MLSVAALILIVVSLAVPVAVLGGFASGDTTGEPSSGAMLGALLFYVVTYFITLFFNTALVGAAMIRMDGGNPRLDDGLRIAWERKGRIFGYACIAATVGLLLRAIEERVGWIGQLVVKLIGVGWALATFLVVPVSVTRDVGPIEAVKESADLLRRTWGENLIGNVGLGLVFAVVYIVLMVIGTFLALLAAQAGSAVLIGLVILVGVMALFGISALQATDEDTIWALKDISFDVKRGEVVGIIGRNGAGKSTLLKVVSRVLVPTEGRVWIRGRVSPLLELGAGFHPELTGRENVFLNGTLLGHSRRDIENHLEEVVSFAELGAFIDAPYGPTPAA